MIKFVSWTWREVFIEPDRSRRERIGRAVAFLCLTGVFLMVPIPAINMFVVELYDPRAGFFPFVAAQIGLLALQLFCGRMACAAAHKRIYSKDGPFRLLLRLDIFSDPYWVIVNAKGNTVRLMAAIHPRPRQAHHIHFPAGEYEAVQD